MDPRPRLVWHWREDRDLPKDDAPLCVLAHVESRRVDRIGLGVDKDRKRGCAVTADSAASGPSSCARIGLSVVWLGRERGQGRRLR